MFVICTKIELMLDNYDDGEYLDPMREYPGFLQGCIVKNLNHPNLI